jgi:mannosyltransferase
VKSPRRVTAATLDVLDVFVCDAPDDLHGFELARRTCRPAGTIYPVLMRLEEMGWLASRWAENAPDGRPRRRLYHLTAPGLAGATRQARPLPGCAAVRRSPAAGEVPLAAITACPLAGPRGDGDARTIDGRVSVEQQLPAEPITGVTHAVAYVVGRAGRPLGPQTGTGRVPPSAVLVPGLVTLLVMVCGITGSSYWKDETATVSATARSLPGLVRMLGRTDAVHGLYYLLMWMVARAAGTSELAFRLPSAGGMALAAAGIAVIAWRLRPGRAGMCAGLVFACLPVISSWGQTARPYALEIAAAVFASYRLLRLPARPGPRPLAAYAASVTLLGYLNLFGLLLVPAHAITIIATSQDTVGLRRWLAAAATGCAVVSPVALLGWRERGQIAWIPAPGAGTVQDLVIMLGAGTVLSAVIIAALAGLGSVSADWPGRERSDNRLTWLCLPWLLVPPLVLLGASQWMHVYGPAYVLYCAPPVALLAGAGLAALRAPWRIAVLAILVGLTVPGQLAARQPAAHVDNIRAAAAFLQRQARAGQGVIYWGGKTWGPPDWALAYPYGFTKLTDLGEQATPAQANDLFGRPVSLGVLEQRMSRVTQIWVIELGHDYPPPSLITHSPFRLTRTWQISDIWLRLYSSQTPVPRQGRAS